MSKAGRGISPQRKEERTIPQDEIKKTVALLVDTLNAHQVKPTVALAAFKMLIAAEALKGNRVTAKAQLETPEMVKN